MKTRTILKLYDALRKARESKMRAMRVVWVAEAQERRIMDFIEKYMSMDDFAKNAELCEEMEANRHRG